MSRGIPPGVHICAARGSVQLRILGDDVRGYLLAGLSHVPGAEQEEFWFPTLPEATGAAALLGIPLDAWREITSVDQVQVRKGG